MRLITPIILIAIGLIYFIASFLIPKAPIGNANGPMYFPALLGAFLLIMSIIYFFQEWKIRDKAIEGVKALFSGRTPKLIGASILLALLYTFLFERIGFLYSTIIFLIGLLFVVNGRKKWITNIVVAVVFSFVTWYSFAELLNVSLP